MIYKQNSHLFLPLADRTGRQKQSSGAAVRGRKQRSKLVALEWNGGKMLKRNFKKFKKKQFSSKIAQKNRFCAQINWKMIFSGWKKHFFQGVFCPTTGPVLCWLENPQNYAAIQTLIEHLWAILKLEQTFWYISFQI